MRVANRCLLSSPLLARFQKETNTLLGGGMSSSLSSSRRAATSQTARPMIMDKDPRTISFLGKSGRILFVKLPIFAVVVAHVDSRINRNAARPTLHHEINRYKALQQRYRQLNSGKRSLVIAADTDLISPEPGRQGAAHAEPAGRNASLNWRQGKLAAWVPLIFAE